MPPSKQLHKQSFLTSGARDAQADWVCERSWASSENVPGRPRSLPCVNESRLEATEPAGRGWSPPTSRDSLRGGGGPAPPTSQSIVPAPPPGIAQPGRPPGRVRRPPRLLPRLGSNSDFEGLLSKNTDNSLRPLCLVFLLCPRLWRAECGMPRRCCRPASAFRVERPLFTPRLLQNLSIYVILVSGVRYSDSTFL